MIEICFSCHEESSFVLAKEDTNYWSNNWDFNRRTFIVPMSTSVWVLFGMVEQEAEELVELLTSGEEISSSSEII